MTVMYFLALAVLTHDGGRNVLLGIPPSLIRGDFDLISFSGWLLMMAVPVLVDGCLLAYIGRIKLFVCIRFRNWNDWSTYLFVLCFFGTLYWSILQSAALFLNTGLHEALSASVLLLANNMLWLALTLTLFYLTKAASICILVPVFLQGGTFLLGEYVSFLRIWMPADWSMVCRTEKLWELGGTVAQYFGLSITVAGCLFLLLYTVVREKLYMEV